MKKLIEKFYENINVIKALMLENEVIIAVIEEQLKHKTNKKRKNKKYEKNKKST